MDSFLLDVDGTLMDSNYQLAVAWFRAFRRLDMTIPVWTIHRAIGMGGDQLVTHLTDEDVEHEYGSALRAYWREEFEPMVSEIQPLPGAHRLLATIKDRGYRLVVASSGPADHVEVYLDRLDGRHLADDWTSADDAQHSKPAPDLLQVAMSKVGAIDPVLVGDSIWDAAAARRADVPFLALRTGGFSTHELTDAGAVQVVETLDEVIDLLDTLPAPASTGAGRAAAPTGSAVGGQGAGVGELQGDDA